VADIEKDRDWDKEMAEVDRLLKKLPNADPTLGRSGGGEPTVRKPAVVPGAATSGGAATTAREWLGTWAKVGLGVLVGIGVAPGVWPYSHGCGLRLIFYLVGVSTVIAAGVWVGLSSWKRRLGFAHVISQVLIVWGILLMTREVLPRVGAKPEALWLCPDVTPTPH
jgi:hypothetical protein